MSASVRSPSPEALSLTELAPALFEDPATGMLVLDRDGWVLRANRTIAGMAKMELAQIEGWPAAMLFVSSDRARFKALLSDARGGIADPAFTPRLDPTGIAVAVELAPLPDILVGEGGQLLRLRECTNPAGCRHSGQDWRLQALGQFAIGIAHDFNNVIAAMLAATGALESTPDESDRRGALAELRGGAARARGLIERLLSFGRPTEHPASPVPIDDAIVDLTAMLRRLFPSRIALSLDLQAPEARVLADPTRIDQVLLNLAINARDAMPKGGTLSIRSRSRDLARGFEASTGQVPAGRHVVIELRDSGIGIPPETLARIFDPYFTTRLGQGGSGLGLATVREIVGELGGALDLHSEVGRGTRLRVYLPRADAQPGPSPERAPPLVRPGPNHGEPAKRGTVLLVEDDRSLRKLAEAALRRGGWAVVCVDCAADALASAERLRAGAGRPSLLITDINLPDMNGWALVNAIRGRLAAPNLPVIVSSGGRTKSFAGDTGHPGSPTMFLAKPYELAELLGLAERFAHGPGPIDIPVFDVKNDAPNIKSPIDEHMTNEARDGARCSVAPEDSNVTDSAELT